MIWRLGLFSYIISMIYGTFQCIVHQSLLEAKSVLRAVASITKGLYLSDALRRYCQRTEQ